MLALCGKARLLLSFFFLKKQQKNAASPKKKRSLAELHLSFAVFYCFTRLCSALLGVTAVATNKKRGNVALKKRGNVGYM
jgi:hypothetical protein